MHFFKRVEWRVAVPSVQGKWSVEEKGVEDKTENPSIGGKFKILLRLLAKRALLPASGSSETGRGSYDDYCA